MVLDRIRHLEAVTSRARQCQVRPPVHSPIQISNSTGETTVIANAQGEGKEHQGVEERVVESGKGSKMKGAELIAKALEEVETDESKKGESSRNFFDCNICLDMARKPVLTSCGHLFCWSCFYHLPYAYSNAKECPVCEGEVIETDIIPIYGNASARSNHDLEINVAGSGVPPRPIAPRVESFRQQLAEFEELESYVQ